MDKPSGWKTIFLIAAIWNWCASITLTLFQELIYSLLGMPPLHDAVFYHLFLSLVFVFGVGYQMVSRDLSANQDIVRLGMIGKVLVFSILAYYYFLGSIHLLLALAGVGDLIFAGLFLAFLKKRKKTDGYRAA
jgi:hypothetical protein